MPHRSTWHRPLVTAFAVLAAAALLGSAAAAEPESDTAAVTAPVVDGAPGAGGPYYPMDGNGGYDVAAYRLNLRYDPRSHQLAGHARITARATSHLGRFDLDLSGLTVTAVHVNGRPATFTREAAHELVITPAEPLPLGFRFAVDVDYQGVPKPLQVPGVGASGWQYSADGGAFVAGEPHSASTWYPVDDTPRDKASFHVALTVPPGWSVVSNGRESPTMPAPDGWNTYRWNEHTPVASYLTTVGVDKWTYRRSELPDGTPIVSAFAPGTEKHMADEKRLPEIIRFLESKFGPYPQDAAGGIFVPDKIAFSLETQTRPLYAQWTDLATIVHETAHQWFGDAVTVHDWRDTCLNECFASYAQSMWAHAKRGLDLDATYRQDIELTEDQPAFWAQRLYDAGKGHEFSGVYSKGALAIHALRRQIGEQAFSAVLHGWPTKYRGQNASWPDFERFVERVSGQNLDGFFQAWFHGTKIPPPRYLWPGSLHP